MKDLGFFPVGRAGMGVSGNFSLGIMPHIYFT